MPHTAMFTPNENNVFQIFILLMALPLESSAGKRVVNNVHESEVRDPLVYFGPSTMEEILQTPEFSEKRAAASLSDAVDTQIWTEALHEYDKILRIKARLKALAAAKTTTTLPTHHPFNPYDRWKYPLFNQKTAVPFFDPEEHWKDHHGNLPDGKPVPVRPYSRDKETSSTENPPESETEEEKMVAVHHKDKIVMGGRGFSELEENDDDVDLNHTATATSNPELQSVSTNNSKGASSDQGQPGNGSGRSEADRITVENRAMTKREITASELYGKCGKPYPEGTVCFGTPADCIEEKACRLVVTFSNVENDPNYISVNFAGESSDNGYIAFGFSDDRFINDDIVVYCINGKKLPKPATALYLAFTKNHHAVTQKSKAYFAQNFRPRSGIMENGMMACSFDLAAKVFLDDGRHTDIKNNPFYQILAFGHFIDSVPVENPRYGGLSSQHLVEFSSDPVVLKTALRHPTVIQPRSRALVQCHAIMAVIVFIFLIPSSIFCAKYGREVHAYNTEIFGRYSMPAWMRNHLVMNVLSLPFIFISLITIMVELDFGWRSYHTMPMLHSISGSLACVWLAGALVTGCFFKTKIYRENSSGNESRPEVLIWSHWLLGNLAYFCAALSLCVSASLTRAQAPCFVEYFGYFHLAIFCCAHIIMAFDTRRLATLFQDLKRRFQRIVLGPMIPWKKGDIYVPKHEKTLEFHNLELWKGRRRVALFIFLVSIIIAFTISVLLLLPVVLCR